MDDVEIKKQNLPKGIWVVSAMIVLFGLPYIISYWWFFIGDVPEVSSNNRGLLIQHQVQFPVISLTDLKGAPVANEQIKGKWILLGFSDEPCGSACQDTLILLRQVRRAVGVERSRVERVMILAPENVDSTLEGLADAFDGMHLLIDRDNNLQPLRRQLIDQTGSLTNSVFIVDPRGQVILAYPSQPNPKDVLKDLQKLLKVSTIG